MDGADRRDVIGADPPVRRIGLPVLIGACVLSLIVGFGFGALAAEDPRSKAVPDEEVEQQPEPDPLRQADGGVVYVCDGHARAFVFASGLPPARAEVLLPLRGDDALLPVLTEGAEVLTGSFEGHQYFLPQEGYLALVQNMGVPDAPFVNAQVGDRVLTLAVRRCGGGPR